MTLVVLTEKHEMCFMSSKNKSLCLFVPLVHKVKAPSGVVYCDPAQAVFISIVSFSFAPGRVILMLSGFGLFSVEVVCVGNWPVTLISHPLFITLALSKCLICHE